MLLHTVSVEKLDVMKAWELHIPVHDFYTTNFEAILTAFYWSIQIQIARISLLIGCRLTNIYYSSYLVHSRHTRYYFVQVWTQRGGVLSVPVQKSRGKDEYFAQLFMRPDSEIWETECISQGCLGIPDYFLLPPQKVVSLNIALECARAMSLNMHGF